MLRKKKSKLMASITYQNVLINHVIVREQKEHKITSILMLKNTVHINTSEVLKNTVNYMLMKQRKPFFQRNFETMFKNHYSYLNQSLLSIINKDAG